MSFTLALVVALFWLLLGVTWGTQRWVSDLLIGGDSGWLWQIRYGIDASIPWIPVSLGIIWMGMRFPFTQDTWKARLPLHLVGAVASSLLANFLIAIGSYGLSGELLLRGTISGTAAWIHVTALLYFAVIGVISVVAYREEMQTREVALAQREADLADARLLTLSTQLRPHFLLNVLHGIGHLWRTGRAVEADRMLEGLGDLFRGILSQTEQIEVPLADELELVREYLSLESVRFQDRLSTSVEADPGLLSIRVPPLILQPLVENAVRHGIGASSEASRIDVRVRASANRLVLEVIDDGPGPEGDTSAAEPGTGVGLANVRRRLEHLYGEDAVSVELATHETGGAVARITIPLTPSEQTG